MIGVMVNTATVVAGSLVGLLFRKGIPERYASAVMTGLGLCTLYIGIAGALKGQNVLIVIVSIVAGAIAGTAIDIDARVNSVGESLGRRFAGNGGGGASIAEGFVTGSLLFCVGAMTIVGSLNAGLSGDNRMIFAKSLLDMIAAAMLTVSLGYGVVFSAAFVFVFQGSIVLLARFLQPVLTAAAIAEITCAGSLMIIAIGLNLLGITKIKVANYLPAVVFVPLFVFLAGLIPAIF
jgi:hypothetical protein